MLGKRVGRSAIVLAISAGLLSGCGLFGSKEETASKIDPPPLTNSQVELDVGVDNQAIETVAGSPAAETLEQTLYLQDANGYIVPVSLALPKVEGLAKQAVQHLVKGGPVEAMLPPGFQAVLPKGTDVLGIDIKNGTATVDFSPHFTKYEEHEERNILDAITRTLTQFDTIQNVTIWVNGHPLKEMPVNHTPISSVLGRNHAVNLELAEGAVPGRTTPVTVYFQGQLDAKRTYYVPVTRLIPETDNLAKAVVEELIKGPSEGSPLFSSLLPTTRVLDIKQTDGTVVVNLSDDVLRFNKGREANPEAMESLVLSLTESLGVDKVQVMVEGEPLTAAGSLDFSQPVSRPLSVNPLRF